MSTVKDDDDFVGGNVTEVVKEFDSEFVKKDKTVRKKIIKAVGFLSKNPKYPSLQAHKIEGSDGIWEAYADMSYRITFEYIGKGDIRLRRNCNHDILGRP